MRLIYVISLILILASRTGLSQDIQVTIDSMERQLRIPASNEDKIETLLRITRAMKSIYPDKAADYAGQAYALAKQENLTELQVRSMIEIGWIMSTKSMIDSSLRISLRAEQLAEQHQLDKEKAMALLVIGINHNYLGNFQESLIDFYAALKIFEIIKDREGIILALNSVGSYCYQQRNNDKAYLYFSRALAMAREINNPELIATVLNNLGLVMTEKNDKEKAIACFTEAIAKNQSSGQLFRLASNYMNLGIIYLNEGKYDEFRRYYDKASEILLQIGNANKLSLCYLNLGDYFLKTNAPDSAVHYTMLAFNTGIRKNLKEIISNAATQLEQVYQAENRPDSALKYLKIHYLYKDSLQGEIHSARLSQLELQYQYENFSKEEKIRQQKKDFLFTIVIILIVAGLIITFLFLSRQIVKTKNVRLENQHLADDLEFKNKELAINVMNLLKKNEFIVEHTNRLIDIQKRASDESLKSEILNLVSSLQRDSGEHAWDEFELRFKQVHTGFYEQLLKQYPDLTSNELKLCALLRLNLSTKEICELTGQRPSSLEVARSRLRKKLGITNPQTNLITFLTQIG